VFSHVTGNLEVSLWEKEGQKRRRTRHMMLPVANDVLGTAEKLLRFDRVDRVLGEMLGRPRTSLQNTWKDEEKGVG